MPQPASRRRRCRSVGAAAVRALAALLVTASVAEAAAAAERAPAAQFGEETAVTLVELPVEVRRDGQSLAGLSAADFTVTESGRELPVVGFEEIVLGPAVPGAGSPGAVATPAAARRHVFLLFDLAFARRERLREGLAEARRALAGLDRSDLVAVGAYAPRGELVVLLSFSSDRVAAARALGALAGAVEGGEAAAGAAGADPLRLTGRGAESLLAAVWPLDERNFAADSLDGLGRAGSRPVGSSGPNAANARGEGFFQRNVLGHSAQLQGPNLQERMRGHAAAMADTLDQLVASLRSVEGRKYLVLFSEGFSGSLLGSSLGSVHSPALGGSALLRALDDTLRELRRAGWVVHAVDLAGARDGLNADGLFYLAAETGGILVEGSADLAAGLGRALAASGHVYVLQVDPGPLAADGAFHPLAVAVRGAGRGTEVRHRAGYHAPQRFRDRPAVARLAEAATLVAGGMPHDDLGVLAVVAPLRESAGSARVGVVVEVPGAAVLGDRSSPGGLEVYGYAVDGEGAHSDHFSYAVDLDPRQAAGRLEGGGVRFVAALDVPRRPHELRLLVRERAGGRWSLLVVPLPSGTAAGGHDVAALFLPPAADPWLVVRDAGADGFELHGRVVAPALRPSLPAAAGAQVLLVGHGLAGAGATLRSRVLGEGGAAVAGEGALRVLAVTPGEGGEPDLAVARLDTAAMPAGSYRLEVVLAASGVARAVASAPFSIGG